jgi:ribosomal protein S12 methylthiotransferase accessory factor YcaO
MQAYTERTHLTTLEGVTVPVTCRLDQNTVDLLDRAVTYDVAPTRAALVVLAVDEWLERHNEELIVESYRRAYAEPDPEHDALMEAFARASFEAIFGNEADDAPR